ncbi:MAG: UPF0280 family protein [Candidatus Bathyarchaeia archaeon]
MKNMIHEYGLIIGPSKIRIKTDKEEAIPEVIREIKYHIQVLQEYVWRKPQFQYSLEPIDEDPNAPLIVRLMIEASRAAGVGPMASVAGAIADLGLRKLLEIGAKVAVIENGGEIAAYTSNREIVVSISTNENRLSGKIGLLITPEGAQLGIATSTGKVDQQVISFGEADSVTVIAENAAIADAAATSICNAIVGEDAWKSISMGMKKAKSIRGVKGAIISYKGYIGLIGRIPRIIKIK